MTQIAPSRPFIFDTEFDAVGGVVQNSAFRPIKRAYSPVEVDALVAQAALDAREAALAEVASIQAMALSTIAQTLSHSAPALTQIAHVHREQSVELALAAARVVAANALDRFPAGPLQAALEALGQEIDASPRLVIRAGDLTPESRAQLERLCADAGFSGVVAFREEPGLAAAAFRLEWADGRADFDPEHAFDRMAEALKSALATEAGHAEPITEGRP
jgi:flagellar assembly protein FliH